MLRSGDLGHRSPGRARLSHGTIIRCTPVSGEDDDADCVATRPGRSGGVARDLSRGAVPVLTPPAGPPFAASAQAVDRIVARGEPVYGINTGFGKLASVKIDRGPSKYFSATSCCRMRPAWASERRSPIVRLMMALKLASLARGPAQASARDGRRGSRL